MWGIFIDNKPLCIMDRQTGQVMPMLFEVKEQSVAIATIMNKELLNVDVAVRPVEIRRQEPEYKYSEEYDGEGEQ